MLRKKCKFKLQQITWQGFMGNSGVNIKYENSLQSILMTKFNFEDILNANN